MIDNEVSDSSLELLIERYPYLFKCLIKIDIEYWSMSRDRLIAVIHENQSQIEQENLELDESPAACMKNIMVLMGEKNLTGYVSRVTGEVHPDFLDLLTVLTRLVKRIVYSYGTKDELPVRIEYLLTSIKHKLMSVFVLFENICVPYLHGAGQNKDNKKKRELGRILDHLEREITDIISQLGTLRTVTEDFKNSAYTCATWMLMLEKAELFSVSVYVYVFAYRQNFVRLVGAM